ncbi:putative RING finger protein P8B7-15c [Nymphaea thermarum]|nr:putative RING finger protein P8B7-15c [Nymphaea thermarum]
MAIYFKFKSAKDYDSIPIDGHFISIGNLKEKIFESKHLGRGTDFDLVVSNPNTEEEYLDEAMLLPKNTSVLVRRVPGRPRMRIVTEREEYYCYLMPQYFYPPSDVENPEPEDPEWDEFGNDLYAIPEVPQVQPNQVLESIPSRVEEDGKIKAHIDMTDMDWQRQLQEASSSGRGFRRGIGGRMMPGRGFGRGGMESKTPPPGYVCHRCKVPGMSTSDSCLLFISLRIPVLVCHCFFDRLGFLASITLLKLYPLYLTGHFIQHCPTNGDPNYDIKKVKPPTGIPKSMLVATPDGSYALPSGAVAVLRPNEAAFEKEIEGLPSTRTVGELPAELRCPLCKDVLKDAVFTSKCCYESFCDKCIREYIITQSKCVCGETNVLADDLLPNKRLRETINRILETKATSSAENGGNVLQIQDMESARCPQPKAPSPTLSATAKEESLQPPVRESSEALKVTVAESEAAAAISAPQQSNEKSKAARSIDQTEATHDSISMKDPISQESALQAEEEVQQKLSMGDPGKKKKKKRLRPPANPMDMQWRNSQDFVPDNSLMHVGPAAYNGYWPGMQFGLDGYMPSYGAGMPYMGYTPSPYDMSFGMLPQDPLAASGYMLPVPPPHREFPEYGIGANPKPPLTREEFEARKAVIRRQRESEQRSERESSRDRDRRSREFNTDADADAHSSLNKKPRLKPRSASLDRSERPTSPAPTRDLDSGRLSPRPPAKRRPEPDDPQMSELTMADRKHKASVFSRISFPDPGDASKKRKSHEPANGSKDADAARSHHDERGKQSSRRSSHDYDYEEDDDRHFKRKASSSRYKADEREWDEHEYGRGYDRPREQRDRDRERERGRPGRHK